MDELVLVWSKGNPARTQKTEQFVRIAIRDRGLHCRYCLLDLWDYDSLAVLDHVIPLCEGGGDEDGNKVIACRDCNGLKGRYRPRGAGLNELVRNATMKVGLARHDRIQANRPDLFERLIGEVDA